jgi:cysteine desulfurase family protein (TIGR01976 family)
MIDSIALRARFPSLDRKHNNYPMIFLDGPGGTQMPEEVIHAISNYYETSNSNTHGEFVTTRETDDIIRKARETIAIFLNAEGEETISFGQNMTSLNFSLAHGIGRILQAGDEILITQLDHEANRGPWLMLREYGIVVREVALLQDGQLDYEDFAKKINEHTRLVAMGWASNALGTVNDVKRIRQLTYQYNCWLMLDAVAYAPHFAIDVKEIGCDFLICSAYKFYGPHMGILYSRPGLLNRIQTDRLITIEQKAPYCIETGTLNHAAIGGITAAIHFIASLGKGDDLRKSLEDAYKVLGEHERGLATKLWNGLKKIPGLTLVGQNFDSEQQRSPTVSFALEKKTPAEVCAHLSKKNVCAWDGHFYAIRAIQVLGLLEKGGVTRLGISFYNTREEIETTIAEIKKIVEEGIRGS